MSSLTGGHLPTFSVLLLKSLSVFILKFNWSSRLLIELLEFSEDRSPWESVEDKLYAIR